MIYVNIIIVYVYRYEYSSAIEHRCDHLLRPSRTNGTGLVQLYICVCILHSNAFPFLAQTFRPPASMHVQARRPRVIADPSLADLREITSVRMARQQTAGQDKVEEETSNGEAVWNNSDSVAAEATRIAERIRLNWDKVDDTDDTKSGLTSPQIRSPALFGSRDSADFAAKVTRRKRNSVLMEEAQLAARRIIAAECEAAAQGHSSTGGGVVLGRAHIASTAEMVTRVEEERRRALDGYAAWSPWKPADHV